ncbi:MAG: ABC transporter substrate-binding protein [Desulfobacteraceae bacterium]|nr:ABC transporter substrate-binding protein [Desulfobacteraceae bacterium]
MKKLFFLFLMLVFICPESYGETVSAHGFAMNGEVKYKKGFSHFEYVNPDAPKGGVFKRAATGSFDSLNPFVLKGLSAGGLSYVFETLCVQSEDEPFSMYGLIAEEITIPESNKYVEFKINEKARFHDGKKITPEDIIFSFNILMEKGSPIYKKYYGDISDVVKISDNKVRFEFKTSDNPELPLIISQLSVLPKHYYEEKGFEAGLVPPLGSGPYRVKDFSPGKFISYERVKDYWGKDLPVNIGMYNFDEIIFDYYRDETVSLEAFKAGAYDFRLENTAKSWAVSYEGPAFEKGEIIKEEIHHKNSSGMQGFVFNLRNKKFQNRNLRKALVYAFDFDWINKNLFYGQYKRSMSYFSNSELASKGLPSKEELEILKPYKGKIPDEVFEKEFFLPDTDSEKTSRYYLRKAAQILKKEGYLVENGKRIDKYSKKPLEFEILISSPAFERIALTYKKSLEKLGIGLEIRRVDDTQFYNRIRNFDYEMITSVFPQSLSPGNEQRYFWGSLAADTPGSRNYCGIKNPVIDEIVEKLISAKGRQNLINHTKALDRVLLWNYYLVPHWHIDYFRVAYKNKFKHPQKTPDYGLGLNSWWQED